MQMKRQTQTNSLTPWIVTYHTAPDSQIIPTSEQICPPLLYSSRLCLVGCRVCLHEEFINLFQSLSCTYCQTPPGPLHKQSSCAVESSEYVFWFKSKQHDCAINLPRQKRKWNLSIRLEKRGATEGKISLTATVTRLWLAVVQACWWFDVIRWCLISWCWFIIALVYCQDKSNGFINKAQ